MSRLSAKEIPLVCHKLLQQEVDVAVWGAAPNLTLHEWQRQIPAKILVDTQPERFAPKATFHGLAARFPTEIARLDPRHSLVFNNFYYSTYANRIENFLGCIGDYRSVAPTPLYEMARLAAVVEKSKSLPPPLPRKKIVASVNEALREILTPPHELHGARHLPPLKDLLHIFNAYTPHDYLAQALPLLREKNVAGNDGHICLFADSLTRGGAERQIANLAVGLKRIGWTPTVLTLRGAKDDGFLRDYLKDNCVAHEMIGAKPDNPAQFAQPLSKMPIEESLVLWHLDAAIAQQALSVYTALQRLRPALIVSYLDLSNCSGGIGSLLAGVPHILMSGRSVAPFFRPDMVSRRVAGQYREIYNLLLAQKNIVFSSNSSAGAESYATWLQAPKNKMPVVPNCVTEDFTRPSATAKQGDVTKDHPLILGVFRFVAPKCPLDFVHVIRVLHKKYPALRALLCGDGPLTGDVRRLIQTSGLEDVITLAGVVDDIPERMQGATLLLHTAKIEGSPNVILEAQTVGLPIVCVENGGTQQFLAEAWTPFMKEAGRVEELAKACAYLLDHPEERKDRAEQARLKTLNETSLETLAQKTLTVGQSH